MDSAPVMGGESSEPQRDTGLKGGSAGRGRGELRRRVRMVLPPAHSGRRDRRVWGPFSCPEIAIGRSSWKPGKWCSMGPHRRNQIRAMRGSARGGRKGASGSLSLSAVVAAFSHMAQATQRFDMYWFTTHATDRIFVFLLAFTSSRRFRPSRRHRERHYEGWITHG